MLHSVMSTDHVRIVVPGGRAVTLTGARILDLYDAKKEADRKDGEEADARMERITKAREVILVHAGPYKKGQDAGARIACPVCQADGETLAYYRSGYNGHVRASCQTANCVQWME